MKSVILRYTRSSKDWFMSAMISRDTGMKLHKERSLHVYGVVKVIFFGNKSGRKWIWDVAINNWKFTVFRERFYSWFYHFTTKTRYLYDGNGEKPQMTVYSSVSINQTRERVVFTSFLNKQKTRLDMLQSMYILKQVDIYTKWFYLNYIYFTYVLEFSVNEGW